MIAAIIRVAGKARQTILFSLSNILQNYVWLAANARAIKIIKTYEVVQLEG